MCTFNYLISYFSIVVTRVNMKDVSFFFRSCLVSTKCFPSNVQLHFPLRAMAIMYFVQNSPNLKNRTHLFHICSCIWAVVSLNLHFLATRFRNIKKYNDSIEFLGQLRGWSKFSFWIIFIKLKNVVVIILCLKTKLYNLLCIFFCGS